jgi:hypothetical protein
MEEKFKPGDQINLDTSRLQAEVFEQVAQDLQKQDSPDFEMVIESLAQDAMREISIEAAQRGSTLTSVIHAEENLSTGEQRITAHVIRYKGSVPEYWKFLKAETKETMENNLLHTALEMFKPIRSISVAFKPSQRQVLVSITYNRLVGDYDMQAIHDRFIKIGITWRDLMCLFYSEQMEKAKAEHIRIQEQKKQNKK